MSQSPQASSRSISTWYIDPDAEDAMADGHAPIWRHLIDLIPEQDLTGKTVLDFGCNQGGFLRLLHGQRPFHKALGIDIAEQSIAKANSLKGNLPIQYQAGAHLEGWADTFDLAFSHEVIYLVEDINRHAAEVWQALKPGGIYYAITGCHTDNPLWPQWRTLVAERTHTVVQDRSVTDYAEAFEAAGFKVSARKLQYEGFIPFTKSDWTPSFADALDYYTATKVVFRLFKPF
ncbi:class I SAM-dependent methyltransferase [Rhizobium helianthi]|uniref:Class I SAM-dependent methyltransferase n=1 Tax=Rhizobium helianthi TaxID=1132695 RepID=A0ABW4M097_9HYPH